MKEIIDRKSNEKSMRYPEKLVASTNFWVEKREKEREGSKVLRFNEIFRWLGK